MTVRVDPERRQRERAAIETLRTAVETLDPNELRQVRALLLDYLESWATALPEPAEILDAIELLRNTLDDGPNDKVGFAVARCCDRALDKAVARGFQHAQGFQLALYTLKGLKPYKAVGSSCVSPYRVLEALSSTAHQLERDPLDLLIEALIANPDDIRFHATAAVYWRSGRFGTLREAIDAAIDIVNTIDDFA